MNTDPSEPQAHLQRFLDWAYARFQGGDIFATMQELISYLSRLRGSVDEPTWNLLLKPTCLCHRLKDLVHEDPYTFRAFRKPRGYSGDTVMLDYVYSQKPPPGTTPLGREVFRATTGMSHSRSLIARRDWIAAIIDSLAAHIRKPSILSVACSHLREAQRSKAVQKGLMGTFYVVDRDDASLEVVAKGYSHLAITPIHCSVAKLLRGAPLFSHLHFIYSAEIVDYLPDPLARRLITRPFEMLSPHGRLVIGNFAPDNHGRRYMEAFMDWELVYRCEHDLEGIVAKIPSDQIDSCSVYRDVEKNVVFLELVKAVK